MTDRHAAVDRWIEWAREREASVEIVARYQVKRGRLVRVVVQPPQEEHPVLDGPAPPAHTPDST